MTNQPSLEDWQEEFKKTLIYKELMNHHQTGIHPESIKHEQLMENMSDFVKPLISQAKAQGAEEERERLKPELEKLNAFESVEHIQSINHAFSGGGIDLLTPQKEVCEGMKTSDILRMSQDISGDWLRKEADKIINHIKEEKV